MKNFELYWIKLSWNSATRFEPWYKCLLPLYVTCKVRFQYFNFVFYIGLEIEDEENSHFKLVTIKSGKMNGKDNLSPVEAHQGQCAVP